MKSTLEVSHVLAIILLLNGCGGSETTSGGVLTLPDQTETRTIAAISTQAPSLSDAPAQNGSFAASEQPQIEHLELIAEKRFDRTNFDYTYRLTLSGGATSFESAQYNVTSTNPATKVLDGSVYIGRINIDQYLRVSDTITIRHNRSTAFNRNALNFAFSGLIVAPASNTSLLEIKSAGLFQVAGRPGHEGYLEYPSTNPIGGAQLQLRVRASGNPSDVKALFKDSAGGLISAVSLVKLNGMTGAFVGNVKIPLSKFYIEVIASSSGPEIKWLSNSYTPTEGGVKIVFENAIYRGSMQIPGKIVIASTDAIKIYKIRLLLPDGFTATETSWSIYSKTEGNVEIPIIITSPSNLNYRMRNIFAAWSSNNQTSETLSYASLFGL